MSAPEWTDKDQRELVRHGDWVGECARNRDAALTNKDSRVVEKACAHIEALEARVAELQGIAKVALEHRLGSMAELASLRAVCAEVAAQLRLGAQWTNRVEDGGRHRDVMHGAATRLEAEAGAK